MELKQYALLISPLAKSAYFGDYRTVALAELELMFPNTEHSWQQHGPLEFILVSLEHDSKQALTQALHLSFVMGLFEFTGSAFIPVSLEAKYNLHEDFVFGSKYRGKTNEHLTQLLLNIGLATTQEKHIEKLKLLDPMCGRATTLMWALRYGINCKGIEKESNALADIRQHLKKWCKLHRQKHTLQEGFVNKANKKKSGKFLEFSVINKAEKKEYKAQIICGDARDAATLLKAEKFNIITSDLPYGIQHTTQDGKRNPIDTVNECAAGWKACLKPGGVIVLSFNKYIPKREAIIEAFTKVGLKNTHFEAPHRMSESIVRDVVVFTH